MGSPAAWHPDPTDRHQLRYWDGGRWTEHVADQGRVRTDALDPRMAFSDPLRLRVEDIDRRIHELQAERDELLLTLARADDVVPARTSDAAAHEDAAGSAGSTRDLSGPERAESQPPTGSPVTGLAPPSGAPIAGEPPQEAAQPTSGRSGFAAFLATSGVFLLAAAALTFTAASWTLMTTTAQFVVLVAATGLVTHLSVRIDRRGLVGVGAAVGVLAVVLAAVSVWGAQRAGAPWPTDFTPVIGALAATAVGWALSRWAVRWVTTAAALALLTAGVTLTVALATHLELGAAAVSLISTTLSVATAATTPTWRTLPARRIVGLGALAGLTAAGLVAAIPLADPSVALPGLLVATLIAVALLVVATRWSSASLGPVSLIVTLSLAALAHRFGPPPEFVDGPSPAVWLAVGLGACLVAWSSLRVDRRLRPALLIGASPAAIALIPATLLAVEGAGARVAGSIGGATATLTDPWVAAGVALGAGALLALQRRPAFLTGLLGLVAITTAGALPDLAAPALLVGTGVGAHALRGRTRTASFVALGVAVVAVGIVAGDRSLLPIVSVAATMLGAWVTVSSRGAERTVATGHTILGTALVVGSTLDALQIDRDVLLATALVAGLVATTFATHRDGAPLPVGSIIALAPLTVVVPAFASGPRPAGLLVMLAAAGWLVMALQGHRFAAWASAAVASLGSVIVLQDLGVQTIELYTVGPAVLFAVVGIHWLATDDTVGTVPALLPALTIALVPSMIVLADDPQMVARLVGLTAVAGVLALVGVVGRLLAPTVAAAIVAIWVALSQVGLVLRTVNPLIVFVVVGVLLVWLGASFERQRRRAGLLIRHVSQFR